MSNFEFSFNLDAEIRKIESTPAKPAKPANRDVTNDGNSRDSQFAASKFEKIPLLDHLTATERQAYQGWYDVMVGDKFKMSPEQAHKKAWSLLQKTSALLAEEGFKRDKFVKIYSVPLGREVYLCKDEATRLPDKTIPVFTVDEIKDFSTLSREDALLLAEAKAIFNPRGFFQDE